MPLRKKHVRRIVFVLLFLLVLGPLAILAIYGAWLGSGGMNAELERELASRLRCKASVSGARPTGISTATAESVRLEWTAGGGHLALELADLLATRNPDGISWTVSATEGRLALEGSDAAATLSAINQRLVQLDAGLPVTHLYVQRLDLALALGPLAVDGEARLALFPRGDVLEAHFLDPTAMDRPSLSLEADAIRPLATMRLDPASDRGVFGGMKADAKDVPAAEIRQLLGEPEEEASRTAGTFDVSVRWHWPEGEADKVTVAVRGRDLELADWTRNVSGGPITGKVQADADYTKTGAGPGQFQCTVKSDGGGLVSAETLRWLEETLPSAHGYGWLLTNSIGYERLAVNFRTTAEGLGCLAEGDDSPPLLVTELFGEEVPILWATAEPFQGRGVLEKLLPALLPSR